MRYVAVDLGAESGRVMVGTFDGETVALAEAHRFANAPVRLPDGLHWDVPRIYSEVLTGLRAAARAHGDSFAGIGIDSWGCDYGLFDAAGRLLGTPYHYRDARTDGVAAEVARVVPAAEQYARIGIAQLPFNTLYQLMAQSRSGDGLLELSRSLLMIPDLLHYWLTGIPRAERTNASTSGALDVHGAWATDLLDRLDIPSHMLLPPAAPGTVLGNVRDDVCDECGLGEVAVLIPATHDTASAVVAVPAEPSADGSADDGIHAVPAYISSGTWSLLGLELRQPVLSEDARLAGFTNEHGAAGTYRFLTNIMGLWLVQECRRIWARAGESWDYEAMTARAAALAAPGIALDVDDPDFLHPPDMPAAIAAQLRRTGQQPPGDPIVLVRVILEGLALKYRIALEEAERLTGTRVRALHIVGGGARNRLLCQLAADACGRPVLAGPVEATALGNVLVQAMGRGEIAGLEEARAVVRASSRVDAYEPGDRSYWDDLYGRLRALQQAPTQPVPKDRPEMDY